MLNDLPGVLCAIAHGGNTNYVNKEEESKSPILLAVEAVSGKWPSYVKKHCGDFFFFLSPRTTL